MGKVDYVDYETILRRLKDGVQKFQSDVQQMKESRKKYTRELFRLIIKRKRRPTFLQAVNDEIYVHLVPAFFRKVQIELVTWIGIGLAEFGEYIIKKSDDIETRKLGLIFDTGGSVSIWYVTKLKEQLDAGHSYPEAWENVIRHMEELYNQDVTVKKA